MKKFFIPSLTILALLVSCSKKEAIIIDESSPKDVEILARINNEETKTDYDISNGTDGFFHWTGTEQISRVIFVDSDTPSVNKVTYTSTTSANNNETSLVFSGAFDDNQTEYALYPASLSVAIATNLYLQLPASYTYNSSSPIKDVIPMVGKINSNGDFEFTPVTGIISVRIKNLPSSARSIAISSSSTTKFCGWSMVSFSPTNYATNLDAIMNAGFSTGNASYQGSNTQTISFTEGLDKTEHDFFFPVAVGSFNGLSITIKDGNGDPIQTISTTEEITTTKGYITRLPIIDLAKSTKVSVTGTSRQFYAYLSKLSATKVKVAVANTADEAITAARNSSIELSSEGIDYKVEMSSALTTTGKYYLGYVVYSGETELRSASIDVYYLSETDSNKLCGTYTFSKLQAFTANATSQWVDLTVASEGCTMTTQVSNNPNVGFIMLTDLIGFNYSGTMTNKSIIQGGRITPISGVVDFGGTYGAGSPLYGHFNDSGWLTFNRNALFTLDGVSYYLTHGDSQYPTVDFVITDSGSRITLTATSSSNGFCFVGENKLKSSGAYSGSEILIKFAGQAPVAYKDY